MIKTKVRCEKGAASQQSEIRHHRSQVSIGGAAARELNCCVLYSNDYAFYGKEHDQD